MSVCRQAARPLAQCLRATEATTTTLPMRPFTTSPASSIDVYKVLRERPEGEIDPADLDPNTAIAPWAEKDLWKAGTPPIGSRRRRFAIRTTQNIPFEQLPYQAFQEARKILAADREEKLAAISAELEKIRKIRETDASVYKGGEEKKAIKLESLRRHVEELKILADINDPNVKRRFEDGLGDMNKPIYRHLAHERWLSYDRKLLDQRVDQFHIVPDLLPKFNPRYDVELHFRRSKVPMGKVLGSNLTEVAPRLRVQPFDAGERLVTVVIIDADVPDATNDAFSKRCHFIASNIPLSPSDTSLALGRLKRDQHVAVPYLPAFAQKGSPRHRLAIFVLDQPAGGPIDVAKIRELYANRNKDPATHAFSLKSFRDKFKLEPAGFTLFRSEWDENTAGVMERAGVPGADVEFRPIRVYSMKPKKAARGWEAKRQGPKFKHLWKYTKRVRGFSNAKGLIVKKRGEGGGRRG
ncbi:phosphatidylethanolamine-binding protein [Plectosphaerella plurivora]|uniref:Large ribosomal subunit protein mL38 n=1 Tax=Plectosphaerella plurivora TaxID=936078 RepID=A0A9P8V5E4_9PEZI|nr:phosphatidylethanolamine-binding protein [Plectosphaerella plurivora]